VVERVKLVEGMEGQDKAKWDLKDHEKKQWRCKGWGWTTSSDPICQLLYHLMDHPSGLARDRNSLPGNIMHSTEILTSGVGEDDGLLCGLGMCDIVGGSRRHSSGYQIGCEDDSLAVSAIQQRMQSQFQRSKGR
jgi:hypothetical protein